MYSEANVFPNSILNTNNAACNKNVLFMIKTPTKGSLFRSDRSDFLKFSSYGLLLLLIEKYKLLTIYYLILAFC